MATILENAQIKTIRQSRKTTAFVCIVHKIQ